jgi:hypothetical protein
MAQPRYGVVSRRQVIRALEASGASLRHRGGEAVIDLGGRHYRLGGRNGVGPVAVQRLLNRMEVAGFSADGFEERLYGAPKGARKRSR